MHAIIETGGKQYRVQEGDVLFLEKLPAEEGAGVVFDRVLAVFTDDDGKFGTPLLAGAKVNGTVLKHGKDKKIIVFKMKPKKAYRRRQGHRQPYTKVEIGKIEA
ncbi:MAG: 50S ribosomal protein L21 [Oscillospiraceae bacterium]|jgi:large subunit ribosomal protein L21|nr:50S ribosomal protein L21 [Oscillospiraceae bacterium]